MARRVELGCMKKFEGTDTREAFSDTSVSDVSSEKEKVKSVPLRKAVANVTGIEESSVSTVGTATSVAASVTPVVCLVSNPSRIGCSIFNDSSSRLLLLCSDQGTVGTDNFSVALAQGDYFECPFGFRGEIQGVWASAVGFARVTEYT